MKSIRSRLLLYMTVSIGMFALLLFGLNTFFAEKYYTEQKKAMLVKSCESVLALVEGLDTRSDFEDSVLDDEIRKIEESTGVTLAIGTKDGKQYYPSIKMSGGPQKPAQTIFTPYTRFGKPMTVINKPGPDPKTPSAAANPNVTVPGENPAPPSAATTPKTDTAEDSTTGHEKTAYFITVNDSRLNIDTLRYQIQMDNKLIMQVWVPMASISESAEISNRFTALIGILTIIMAGIWAFYISDRFSRPIQQISSITKRMSELDFSETLKLKGRDEITQLSDSINNLSFSLDSSIKELNEKNRQLEEDILRERELDKMRRQFMSSVSHELKSPVFLIQGYAEGLKSNILTDEAKKNFYCDVIMDEADKMNVLVSDLLDLAQLQSGMFRISPCSFDISILVHDIVRKMQPVFDERSIWASIVQECRNVEVSADPVRIEQVVVNYLNNALVHVDSHKRIQISITCSESKVRVSVYNSGGHIPPDKLDKIWASFYKLDEARTRDIGGTGLGLSIVRAIMDAHGSECGVRNVFSNVDIASKTYLEEGVEFWFEVAQNG